MRSHLAVAGVALVVGILIGGHAMQDSAPAATPTTAQQVVTKTKTVTVTKEVTSYKLTDECKQALNISESVRNNSVAVLGSYTDSLLVMADTQEAIALEDFLTLTDSQVSMRDLIAATQGSANNLGEVAARYDDMLAECNTSIQDK